MIIIVFLIIAETLASYHNDTRRSLKSYDSYEWKVGVSEPIPEYSISQFWWERYTTVSTTPAWWSSISTTTSATIEPATTTDDGTTEFIPKSVNISLSPQEVVNMFSDMNKLNETVVEQSKKIFGEDRPELHELVYKWMFELANRTKVDENTTFITTTEPTYDETPAFTGDETLRNNIGYEMKPESHRYLENQPGLRPPPGFQGKPPEFNMESRGPASSQRLPSGSQGYPLGFQVYQPGSEGAPSGFQGYPPGSEGAPPGFQGYSPGSEGVPPGSQGYPHGSERAPPDFQGYPPGSGGVPPGSHGYPPRSEKVPPDYQGYSPGSEGAPPDYQEYLPGSEGVPLGSQGYPPGSERVPPGSRGYPPGPERLPTNFQENSPSSGGVLPGSQKYPPGSERYSPGSGRVPSGSKGVPPGHQGYPPGSEGVSPGSEGVPPGSQGYPSGSQGYPPGSQGYAPGSEGVPPGHEGYPSGSERVPPGFHGYPSGSERVPPGSQGYSLGSEGVPPGFQGYTTGFQGSPSGYHDPNPYAQQQGGSIRPGAYSILGAEENRGPRNQGTPQGREITVAITPITQPSVSIPKPSPAPPFERQHMEYREMFEPPPNYEDMKGYMGDGRPKMVNDGATSFLIDGITIPVSTTLHPLVESLKQNMLIGDNGYFNTFLSKLLELVASKETDDAGSLIISTDMILQDMDRQGSLHFLGEPFQPSIMKFSQAMSGLAPEVVQSHASTGHRILADRHTVLPQDSNDIIHALNRMYLFREGDELFKSLVDMDEFPDNNATSGAVMKNMISAVMEPFYRLKGTLQLRNLLDMINVAIADRFPNRRTNLEYIDSKDSNKPKARAKTESRFIKLVEINQTERKYDGMYTLHNRGKNRKLTRKITFHTTAVTNMNVYRKRSKNVDVGNTKKIRYKLKSKGLDIETDRDFTIDKHEHGMIDLKKFVKHKIKKHLKTKHHEIYENYRNKHKQMKAKYNKPRFDGYYYEKLLRNRFLRDVKENTKVEVTSSKTRKRTSKKYSQKRFNIVNSVATTPSTKQSINIKKRKTAEAKIYNEISKYLSKYKLKKKAPRLDKTVIKTNKKVYKDSSFTDDEKDLKFNLQDTLRHGDRKFVQRRNYRIKNRKNINELSSYSDEEDVLKNKIYKVFGYSQGMI